MLLLNGMKYRSFAVANDQGYKGLSSDEMPIICDNSLEVE
jgi:hypothetical protein